MTRVATMRLAEEIWSDATYHNGRPEEKTDAPTKIVWMVAGITGSAIFFGSFGLLLMPLIAGWSWLGAGVAFVGAQYASQVLLDLREYWIKATAFLWLGRQLTKGDVGETLAQNRHLWAEA